MVKYVLFLSLLFPLVGEAAPAKPAPLEQLAGVYDGVHRDWRDSVTLRADGTYARGNGDPGKWTFNGKAIVLNWKNWGSEPVDFRRPGVFQASDGHLSLTLRQPPEYRDIPGVYEGVHRDWKDKVYLRKDGTYARGNGDSGIWIYDGKTLALCWKNWGRPVMSQGRPGEWVGENGGFRIRKVGDEQAPVGMGPEPEHHRRHDHWPAQIISTNKSSYKRGEAIIVTYDGMPGDATDWTNVILADQATDVWGNWEYTSGKNGSRTVTGLSPGEYEARAYFSGGTDLQGRVKFRITP